MMRTTILVTALLVSMLSASAVYAQKVEATLEDVHPVINCEGMPLEAYTTTTKGNTEAVLKTAAANATVYKRFAVSRNDDSSGSNWSNAFSLCSNLGDGWRLPTQRELMLMCVLNSALKKTSGFSPITANYHRSATEYEGSRCWNVDFTNGGTYFNGKGTSTKVRCVRELPIP